MTCIIGLAEDDKVWIGGDSAGASNGWTVRAIASPKVFRVGPFIIGSMGSPRMSQILRYHLDVSEQGGETDNEYIVTVFAEAVREAFKERGFAKIEDNREEGGRFLVGYRGVLYKMWGDFQIGAYADGMAAGGCGEEFVLGAMKALNFLPPRERIEKALEVAAYFSGGVLPPFIVLEGR